MPRELRATLPTARCIGVHCGRAEDLHRAEHHREVRRVRDLVAIDHVRAGPHVRQHVIADPPREQHRIRIDLQGEVEIPEAVARDDLIPEGHEELRVPRCAVLGDPDSDLRDQDRLDLGTVRAPSPQGVRLGSEDIVAVALEDARARTELLLQQRPLVPAGHEEGDAVERGVALEGEAPALRAEGLAIPRLVAILGVWLLAADWKALRPVVALLVAAVPYCVATARVHAVLPDGRAPIPHPRRHHAARLLEVLADHRGRAHANGHAVAAVLRTRLTREAALRVRPVLSVALHAWLGAAALRGTGLAVPGADRWHPWRGAGRPGPQRLASPRTPILLAQVRARCTVGEALGPRRVLPEALGAAHLAAARLAAVLSPGRAERRHARRSLPHGLALPRGGRHRVHHVRARGADGEALRPPCVLRVALEARALAAAGGEAILPLRCAGVLLLQDRRLRDGLVHDAQHAPPAHGRRRGRPPGATHGGQRRDAREADNYGQHSEQPSAQSPTL
mmetsp:Transcript_99135/g.286045  ORF Transcript_99135/g.286045 Transcript_99135/m.286045 type:complete len:507 (+) Transcript_99135:524-2044(+)